MALAELQARFAAALRADPHAPLDPALQARLREDGIAASGRLDVYRRNLRGNFHKVMALEFPAIQRLGGADWFAGLALEFMREHPSRSGDLHGIGAPFPAFLARQLAGTRYAWFADVAALEWAWQECLVAADAATTLDVAALAGVGAERAARLRFVPHPALRLVESRWPVFSIWNAHRDGADDGDGVDDGDGDATPLDLDAGGEAVLLRRLADGAEARRCTPAQFAWLRALAADATLGEAWDRAAAIDAEFDVARALAEAVALGLFVAFRDPAK